MTRLLFLIAFTFATGQEIPLTASGYDHWFPRFSPGGEWIVCCRVSPAGDSQVCRIPAAGGSEFVLDSGPAAFPDWSADGSRICFERRDSTGWLQLYSIRPDGSELTALTFAPADHRNPEFSPGDSWITYWRRDTAGRHQVYKVSRSAGPEIQLADFEHYCNVPRWSPDGASIVFQERDSTQGDTIGIWRIYVVSSQGGPETRLTHIPAMHEGPNWSPDGQWIAYELRYLRVGEYSQVYLVPSEGGEEVALTTAPVTHERPVWSPNREWIAYERLGNPWRFRQLYLISPEGGRETPLTTDDDGHHYAPDWSPDGQWVTYCRYDSTGHLQVYKVSLAVALQAGSVPAVAPPLSASPNPFRGSTTIRFGPATGNEALVRIFDIGGRLVRTLRMSEGHAAWDGRDARSRTLPSSVYFACSGNQSLEIVIER
jgi:Tol biopolymer transport system component